MSAPNVHLTPNVAGKNHKLGSNITICGAEPESLLFHRLMVGGEYTATSSSASASNQRGFTTTGGATREKRSTGASAGRIPSTETAENLRSDHDDWTEADYDAIRAMLLNANCDVTVDQWKPEASSKIAVFEPAKQYWLHAKCRTEEGKKEVYIPTQAIEWQRVSSGYWPKYKVKLNPERLGGEMESAFRAVGVKPSSLVASTSQAQAGTSASARKRRGAFANNKGAKRGRGTASRVSISEVGELSRFMVKVSDNPAPVAIMAIQDCEIVVPGDEREEMEEIIVREDCRSEEELHVAAGLLMLSKNIEVSDAAVPSPSG